MIGIKEKFSSPNLTMFLVARRDALMVGSWIIDSFEFFTVNTKLAEMAVLASKNLTTANKKLPPVGLDLMQEIITCLRVQCLTEWAKLACDSLGIFKLLFMYHFIFGLKWFS